MTRDMPLEHDQLLTALLSRYDHSLAGEEPDADLDAGTIDTSIAVDTALDDDLRAGQECLDLLHRVRRHWTPPVSNGCEATPADHLRGLTFGRFRIERELGQGGLGIVYLAFDLKLGRLVALKVPRPECLINEDMRRRFLREAEAAARLNHPHLVTVHDAGEEGVVCYLAAEYCTGQNLAQWLGENSSVAPRLAAVLVERLACAVQHAHSHGVLHRDIKPSNILLQPRSAAAEFPPADDSPPLIDELDFEPKLTDFGMAKLMEQERGETRTGARIGTPAYMSPEQAAGRIHELDVRSDVYALGAVLYEMLTGSAPAAGESDIESLRKVLYEEPLAPRRVRREVPRDLEAICLKCLARRQAERYPTAQSLAEDLQRYLAGRPTDARPVLAIEAAWKWARRRPAVATAWGVVLAAMLTVMGMFVSYDASLSRALGDARRLLYAADMRIALDAWHHDNVAVIHERLAQYVPQEGEEDLRTFPWYFLHRRAYGDRQELYREKNDIYAVAYSPDGTLLVSAGADREIQCWDVARQSLRPPLVGHSADVNDLEFSADGRWLASSSDDQTIRVWTIDGSAEPRVLSGFALDAVWGLSFSPDGDVLAAAGKEGNIWLFTTDNWQLAQTLPGTPHTLHEIAFSPDNTRLAVTDGQNVVVHAIKYGTAPVVFKSEHNSQAEFLAVAWSHNGKMLAAGGNGEQPVMCWNAASGEALATIENPDHWIHSLAFSPDDDQLATAGRSGVVRLWYVAKFSPEHKLLAATGAMRDIAYSPDGKSLATVGSDCVVTSWNLQSLDHRETHIARSTEATAIAFSPADDRCAVLYKGRYIALHDLVNEPGMRKIDGRRHKLDEVLDFSTDGRRLVYTRENGKRLAIEDVSAAEVEVLPLNASPFQRACFLPDGRRIAATDADGTISLWDVESRARIAAQNTDQRMLPIDVAYSGRENLILTGGHGGVRCWDPDSLNERAAMPGMSDRVCAMALSRDEQLLAAGAFNGSVQIWDLPRRRPLTLLGGFRVAVECVSFSPDGKTLAAVADNSAVHLWDTRTWQNLGELSTLPDVGQPTELRTIAFSHDGTALLTGGLDASSRGCALFWSAACHESGERDLILSTQSKSAATGR